MEKADLELDPKEWQDLKKQQADRKAGRGGG